MEETERERTKKQRKIVYVLTVNCYSEASGVLLTCKTVYKWCESARGFVPRLFLREGEIGEKRNYSGLMTIVSRSSM